MINRHFIKMFVLFVGILVIGFVVIAFTGEGERPTSFASAVQSVLEQIRTTSK